MDKFHHNCKFYIKRNDKYCKRFKCSIVCTDVEPENYICWKSKSELLKGEDRMTGKCFCDNSGEQIGLSESRWVYHIPGKVVTLYSHDSSITPEVKKRADEIKALREEYNLSFDETLHLIRSLYLF